VSERRPLDVGRIVEALDRHGVEYLLVEGVAATAHGAERLTADADTVVRRTTENLEATAAVLRDLHAHPLVEGLSDEEARALPVQIDALTLTKMGSRPGGPMPVTSTSSSSFLPGTETG